jgi:hypothetical protein
VDRCAVQQALRRVFAQWGLPDKLRFDNGSPWASHSDLPSDFAMWLVGLGIDVIFNHAHVPEQNAKAERQHAVLNCWAEPESCSGYEQLAQRLCEAQRMQRECYEVAEGKSRLELYPRLLDKRRLYGDELQSWRIEPVKAWLARGKWSRHVDVNGKISLYGWFYNVGRRWAAHQVLVSFDATTSQWVISDQEGAEIVRHAAKEINPEQICGLCVSRPRS